MSDSKTNFLPTSTSKLLPAVLLIAIGVHQLLKAHTEDLTSWKGGGFGMFATLDQQRFAKLYITRKGQVFAVSIPDDQRILRVYRKALAWPTKQTSIDLAELVDQTMELPDNEQAAVAIFFVDFHQKTPRTVVARPVHMMSSKPELSRGKLEWKW